MPIYDFRDTKTGKTFEEMMTISAKEQYLKDNPHMKQIINGGNFIYSNNILKTAGDGWKEVQDKIKSGLLVIISIILLKFII